MIYVRLSLRIRT